jgi:bacteriocin biosynthesis cyclodehydratase domain-containing protein
MPHDPVRRPDLVVLAPTWADPLDHARQLVLDRTPHLAVEVRDATGVVGPLVLPGRTPCLRCLDLTRGDLDPSWPALAAQLTTASSQQSACDGPLALAVAAQAAMQVLAVVDGSADPATLGGTLELALPDWRWRRRSWPRHDDCDCGRSGRAPAPPDSGPSQPGARRAGTASAADRSGTAVRGPGAPRAAGGQGAAVRSPGASRAAG